MARSDQMYEKDGVTPWDGRNSQGPMDYGIKYAPTTLEEVFEAVVNYTPANELKKRLIEIGYEIWRQGYERGKADGPPSK